MAYNAKVFNVMIALPGDVASERSIIRDVIYEWNSIHSESRNIVLLPIGRESHSYPEMGATPQEIINKQVLERCDLLIGVFWTRLGTSTTKFSSGTVEEIEKHMQSGKPAMLYFSSQPVAMDTVDMEQVSLLYEFKSSCQNRGLFEQYDSISEFRNKLFRQLQIKLNEHEIFNNTVQEEYQSKVIDSHFSIPSLSKKAKVILKETSLDAYGNVLLLRHMGGTLLQVNGKSLIETNERKQVAKWESAVNELLVNELLIDKGKKGEVFEITNLSYQIADMIEL